MTDFSFANHGSITLLTPRSRKAKSWLNEHINEEAQYWGASVVIEPRYVGAILQGIADDGLTVGG